MMKNKGQIALVVLLVMAGALTLGMAVSKRAVVETRIDKDEELLKQAFNAAESGIDQYLGTGNLDSYVASDNGSSATVSLSVLNSGQLISFNDSIMANKNEVFWLVSHKNDGSLDFNNTYRGNLINLCLKVGFINPLKVAYFYRTDSDKVRVDRWVFNSDTDLVPITYDSTYSGCPSGQQRIMEINTKVASNYRPLLLVITPLGVSTRASLVSGDAVNSFPSQGKLITSTGYAQSGVNITVKQEMRWSGGILDYMLEPLQSETSISN